jgi:hypothetical protein
MDMGTEDAETETGFLMLTQRAERLEKKQESLVLRLNDLDVALAGTTGQGPLKQHAEQLKH